GPHPIPGLTPFALHCRPCGAPDTVRPRLVTGAGTVHGTEYSVVSIRYSIPPEPLEDAALGQLGVLSTEYSVLHPAPCAVRREGSEPQRGGREKRRASALVRLGPARLPVVQAGQVGEAVQRGPHRLVGPDAPGPVARADP